MKIQDQYFKEIKVATDRSAVLTRMIASGIGSLLGSSNYVQIKKGYFRGQESKGPKPKRRKFKGYRRGK